MSGYLGAKSASGAFQAVIGSMPPHDTYIEAFAGSGAVLRAKPKAGRSIVISGYPSEAERNVVPARLLAVNDQSGRNRH